MGIGDEIMAAAQAREVACRDCVPVHILDRKGRPRDHWVWRKNAHIAPPEYGGPVSRITNGPSARPYVDYSKSDKRRWFYTSWKAPELSPADLPWLDWDAMRPMEYVIVEPTLKANASPNKQWGKWQRFVNANPDIKFMQLGPGNANRLQGVKHVQTRTFHEALVYLGSARAAVLPEGGLHHAAAAMDVPSIVLFGGMTSPDNTGYANQTNLYVDDEEALGWRVPNKACDRAWDLITVDLVSQTLRSLLDAQVPHHV